MCAEFLGRRREVGARPEGAEFGVGAAVAVLHAVRLITVLLILPLVVRWILPPGGAPPAG